MKVKVEVVSHDRFENKAGVFRHSLECVDAGSEPRLGNTFDYSYSDADSDKFGDPARLKGKAIILGVVSIRSGYGGRIRMSGKVIECPKAA